MRWRTYTMGDSNPIKELQDRAIPAMRTDFEKLQGFFLGCDYSAALDAELRGGS